MRRSKNIKHKIIFNAVPILVVATLLATASYFYITQAERTAGTDIVHKMKPGRDYDKFWADKIHSVKYKDGEIQVNLAADKVVHRKRVSSLLYVYQNLKEVYMSGVKIDFYLADSTKDIAIPLNDIGGIFFGDPSGDIEQYLAGSVDKDLDLLTRLLFEDMSLNINFPGDKNISIIAKKARINAGFKNIVFEGRIKVTASDGNELYSSVAVWSKEFKGFYFPAGYAFRDEHYRGRAFFTVNTSGELLNIPEPPDIEYADFIEEKEKVLFSKITEDSPLFLRHAKYGIGLKE